MSEWVIGIIGGSGLYQLDALENPQWIKVDTPWGEPSDELLIGTITGTKCVFLPRHGRGRRYRFDIHISYWFIMRRNGSG